jgi:phospholipid transport system substrate-binding protein
VRTALILLLSAAAPRMSATEFLKARDAEIRALLPKPGEELTPERRAKIEDVLIRSVDLEAMAKAALAKHWDEQPPAKRKQFLRAFEARFKKLSGDQIEGYRSSQTKFFPEEKGEDGLVRVPTELVIKGEPTQVVYALKPWHGSWRIVDIIIDDVSTVENYRASFSKIIKQDGFDGLIARLSKKT